MRAGLTCFQPLFKVLFKGGVIVTDSNMSWQCVSQAKLSALTSRSAPTPLWPLLNHHNSGTEGEIESVLRIPSRVGRRRDTICGRSAATSTFGALYSIIPHWFC